MKKIFMFTFVVLCSSYGCLETKASCHDADLTTKGTGRPFTRPYFNGQNDLSATADRFQPYGMNSLLVQWTEGDDASLEGHYSFRYTIFDSRIDYEGCLKSSEKIGIKPIVFFSFTGEFDFYMGTRDSGPVINRTSNPALHSYFIVNNHPIIDYFDVALEHRSNGQTTDVDERDSNGNLKTQVAYDDKDHEYFDTISRGSNFFSFTTGTDNEVWNWQASMKAYFSENTEVNWGGLADDNVDITDYDIFRFSLSKKYQPCKNRDCLFPVITVASEYTVGKDLFDTDSIELFLIFPSESRSQKTQFPWVIKVHYGPMDTLSNYTKSVTSVGVGWAFSY